MGEKDMGKKKQKVLYDADGARRVMRKRDYMADMGGQLALGVMANLVGQLTYFYTDKVGMAVKYTDQLKVNSGRFKEQKLSFFLNLTFSEKTYKAKLK